MPLRSELFSADQMEQHGRSLAAAHDVTSRPGPDQLLPRLAANEAVLVDACNRLTAAVRANRRITPAGEWLLDNFYLIEDQIRTAKRHLPKGYSRELPRLVSGPSAQLPRVYDIALLAFAFASSWSVAGASTVASSAAGAETVSPILKSGNFISPTENSSNDANGFAPGVVDESAGVFSTVAAAKV